MGDLRKKFTFSKVAMLCLVAFVAIFTFSVSVGTLLKTNKNLVPVQKQQNMMDPEDWDWVSIAAANMKNHGYLEKDDINNILYLYSPIELAYFNYQIQATGDDHFDYSGWTVKLRANLDMGEQDSSLDDGKTTITPRWTPIPTGHNDNINIKFDGAGYKIYNLTIDVDDTATGLDHVGVGFFSNLVDGSVENVEFVNPVINFYYHCVEPSAKVLSQPVAVTAGVVAGSAAGTEIRDVIITNPQITFNTNNYNGHQFAVGSVVGKLTDRKIDGSKPDMGIIDAALVTDGSVTLNINRDGAAGGTATQGNLGGLAGINFSGKVINSKIKNVGLNANLNQAVGTYYHGGLVGQSALRVCDTSEIQVAGLMNNIIITDLTVTGAGDNTTSYTGAIAAWICGGWAYSNFYFGTKHSSNLFGSDRSGYAMFSKDLLYYPQNCVGYTNPDALHEFFNHEGFACGSSIETTDHSYQCNLGGSHTLYVRNLFEDVVNDGRENNIGGMNMASSSFTQGTFTLNFRYLSDFESTSGQLYKMALLVVEYDYDIKNYKADVDDPIYRQAVNQFRIWVTDEATNEPYFGTSLGKKYDVIFDANTPEDYAESYTAGWLIDGNIEDYVAEDMYYYDTPDVRPTLVEQYTYKETIKKPAVEPILKGYHFTGWYAKKNPAYNDEPYFYTPKKMGDEPITIYATWYETNYIVEFYVDGEQFYLPNERVGYNTLIGSPSDKPGKSGADFAGWFTLDQLTEDYTVIDGAQPWNFDTDRMPALYENQVFKLHAGWTYNFLDLKALADAAEEQYLGELKQYIWSTTELQNVLDEIRKKIDTPEQVATSIAELKTRLQNAIDALLVNDGKLEDLVQEVNASDENKYPFLYSAKAYANFQNAKMLAEDYLKNLSGSNLHNIKLLKKIYDQLDDAYSNLLDNPNPNIPEAQKSKLKNDYNTVMRTLYRYSESDYSTAAWRSFIEARNKFVEEFAKDNPYYDDLQAVIAGVKQAEVALFDDDGAERGKQPTSNNVPFLLIGILVCVVILLGVGGFIGFDIYKHKPSKPKVQTVAKNTQTAAGAAVSEPSTPVEDSDDGDYV